MAAKKGAEGPRPSSHLAAPAPALGPPGHPTLLCSASRARLPALCGLTCSYPQVGFYFQENITQHPFEEQLVPGEHHPERKKATKDF